ncbi:MULTISPECIES: hypothetical protein [Moorena]|nr:MULTISPECIES: hypothetical protein [Moorena]
MFASILVHCSQIRCSLFPTTAAKSSVPLTDNPSLDGDDFAKKAV